jgi:hypothetical protein
MDGAAARQIRWVSVLALATAVAMLGASSLTPPAGAHTLSASRARRAADAYAEKLQFQLEGGYAHSVRSCARKSAHIQKCRIRVLTAADNQLRCGEAVVVKFRGPRSHRVRVVPLEKTFRCFVQR